MLHWQKIFYQQCNPPFILLRCDPRAEGDAEREPVPLDYSTQWRAVAAEISGAASNLCVSQPRRRYRGTTSATPRTTRPSAFRLSRSPPQTLTPSSTKICLLFTIPKANPFDSLRTWRRSTGCSCGPAASSSRSTFGSRDRDSPERPSSRYCFSNNLLEKAWCFAEFPSGNHILCVSLHLMISSDRYAVNFLLFSLS